MLIRIEKLFAYPVSLKGIVIFSIRDVRCPPYSKILICSQPQKMKKMDRSLRIRKLGKELHTE